MGHRNGADPGTPLMGGPLIFALVDGNSFYCSCERAFSPALARRPVVVLSNNDGCVIARTAEAKALGIAMGEPWHEVRRRGLDQGWFSQLAWFSSNYPLYGDMSRRMYEILGGYSPWVEPYSIDEMFLGFGPEDLQVPGSILELGHEIRARVLREAKIPTCVGFGPTKTLAKLANKHAKQNAVLGGVCDLTDPALRDSLLASWPVGDVWGIGPAAARRLARHGVRSAGELAALPLALVRAELTVVGARVQAELRGVSCLPLSLMAGPRKGAAVTRSLARPVTLLSDMEEVWTEFAFRAAAKIRRQGLVAGHLQVFLSTSRFRDAAFGRQGRSRMAGGRIEAGNCGLQLIQTALRLGRTIWKEGYEYGRAGILLSDLRPAQESPADLLPSREPGRAARLMEAVDQLNGRFGRDSVRPARLAGHRPAGRVFLPGRAAERAAEAGNWRTRAARLSPAYTTRLEDVLVAHAGPEDTMPKTPYNSNVRYFSI